jgi:predicted anti-sigma-YlaC factor YlaD
MHVGWALWCTVGIISISRALWLRIGAVLYVIVTTLVVVATGNHWILDAAVGAAITAGVFLVQRQLSRDQDVARVPAQRSGPPAERTQAIGRGDADLAPEPDSALVPVRPCQA